MNVEQLQEDDKYIRVLKAKQKELAEINAYYDAELERLSGWHYGAELERLNGWYKEQLERKIKVGE